MSIRSCVLFVSYLVIMIFLAVVLVENPLKYVVGIPIAVVITFVTIIASEDRK